MHVTSLRVYDVKNAETVLSDCVVQENVCLTSCITCSKYVYFTHTFHEVNDKTFCGRPDNNGLSQHHSGNSAGNA